MTEVHEDVRIFGRTEYYPCSNSFLNAARFALLALWSSMIEKVMSRYLFLNSGTVSKEKTKVIYQCKLILKHDERFVLNDFVERVCTRLSMSFAGDLKILYVMLQSLIQQCLRMYGGKTDTKHYQAKTLRENIVPMYKRKSHEIGAFNFYSSYGAKA